MIVAEPVGDQVGDGGDLEPVGLREVDEIRQPGHGAVVVHDLADHAGGIKSREPRDIHGSFGVAGAYQHATILGDQREHVARRHDVPEVLGRIYGDGDSMRPGHGRDAGAYAFTRLDGHGERRGMAGAVGARHQLKMQLLGTVGVQREADQSAAMLGHEVDGVWRRHLRRMTRSPLFSAPRRRRE